MYSKRLTRELKKHDRDLFAERDLNGLTTVFRRTKRVEYFNFEGFRFGYVCPDKQSVLFLTDNWNVRGRPVEWGVLPILNRLKAIDLFSNEDLFRQMSEENEKVDKSNKRNFDNSIESFLYEYREGFKKSFSDVNTSLMRKDLRR